PGCSTSNRNRKSCRSLRNPRHRNEGRPAMLARFFIDRPIFAVVVSIIITLAGSIAVFSLPIAQYPQITPPSVSVSISYPGASAEVVAQTIAAPIEQAVNGVQGM